MKHLSANLRKAIKTALVDRYPTYHKDGTITVRAGFHYASNSGLNALTTRAIASLSNIGINAKVSASGTQFRPFKGGDSTAKGQGSFYWITLSNFSETIATQETV